LRHQRPPRHLLARRLLHEVPGWRPLPHNIAGKKRSLWRIMKSTRSCVNLKTWNLQVNAKATCCSSCIMMSLCPPHMTSFSDNADLAPMLAWPTEFGIGRTLNSDSNTPLDRC
jgi:hypothetical protein